MVDNLQIGGLANPWRAGRNSSGSRLSILDGSGNGADVLKRALSRVKPDDGGEAHFRFGKASRFTAVTPEQRTQPGATVTWPDDGNQDDEPKEIHIIEYDEVSRCWETIRVENPDDSEQYVMVRNTTRVVFVGRDDGLYRAFNLAKAGDYK
ncbi:hypothetical protein EN829_015075 [Mesorhizobium sp. M00.F.Ca.ET.186.01.1.1]|nr:hypothetical protein EN848_14360 [bacterium M00.F.Ca.ET.205.01.1.1]TGU53003.1 hypothetical protein EN795_15035 [bacterium M00.F.Ca.ET.152.01.1.1]TGV35972.1 hypothetical protein EN829_015075 [Mesorhizobium sp. M00.F.Ca.ET.186.01.1.1]TGZ43555.1 hypothetical protein EN805_10645 [bacterium M00.F.Ca.ET.162.01.1.1]